MDSHLSPPDPDAPGFLAGSFELRVHRVQETTLHTDGVDVTPHHVWFASERSLGRWLALADSRDGSPRAAQQAWSELDLEAFAGLARFAGVHSADAAAAPVGIARLQSWLIHLMDPSLRSCIASAAPGEIEAIRDVTEDAIDQGLESILAMVAQGARR